ncbi:hypothetical protein MUP77_09030, partial [Candidatus Bathyarchaeota archaeon]|nr:hypothetical protein [Candidatus Bathyarchaeota archaeon]
MVMKRDLVIAVLCTFCLAFTLFAILPAGSNNSTLGTGEYDPWLDSNEDGRINILECITLANAFGTSGDPTRNVNVTNWTPSYKIDDYTGINYSWTNFGQLTTSSSMSGSTDGFSRMSVQLPVYTWSTSSPTWVNVSCNSIAWMIYPPTGPY